MNPDAQVTYAQRHALAAAVTVASTGLQIGADNRAIGWEDLDVLVANDAAFAVVPAPRLLVVDLDVTEVPPAVARTRQRAFDRLIAAARTHGVPHVVASSGRPGHRHAFVVVGDGGAQRIALEAACRAAGLDVRTRGVRPPLSAHRTGGRGALLHPATPELAVAALRAAPPDRCIALLASAVGARLSHRVRRTLVDGFGAGGYASASEGRMALAVHCVSRGLTPDDLRRLLDDLSHALGASFRSRPARWRAREVERLWRKATTWVAAHPRVAHRADDVATVAAAAARSAWRGMAGASDLAVLEALLDVARGAGRTVVGAALGDLAVGAGLSVDATRAAVRRLTAAGWLAVVAEATPTTARTYLLHVPAGWTPATGVTARDVADRDELWADLGADAARWRALGKSATRVARVLSDTATSVAVLAERLATTPNAVRIHLRRLAAHGVAQRTAGGWVRAATDPGDVAEALGSAGTRRRQQTELALRRADRQRLRTQWSAAVGALHRAYRSGDEASWWDAVATLPSRVVHRHRQRLRARHAPPAFAV